MSDNADEQPSPDQAGNDPVNRDGLAAMAILLLTIAFIALVISQIV